MVRSVPVPSSRVNWRSFLDFLTASQAFTFTARKSDLEKVSKSTCSSNNGSTFTLEKSIFSFGVKNPLLSPAVWLSAASAACAALFASFFAAPCVFMVGNRSTSLIAAELVSSMHILSIPKPIPPVGGIPISSAFKKSSSVWFASSSPAANSSSCALKRSLWSIGSFNSE